MSVTQLENTIDYIMYCLAEHGPMTPAALSEVIGVSEDRVVSALRRMESAKMVCKVTTYHIRGDSDASVPRD